MLAWLLTQIQRVAVKFEEDKQYGAAVGCYRLIYDLIFKDMKKKQSTSTSSWQLQKVIVDLIAYWTATGQY